MIVDGLRVAVLLAFVGLAHWTRRHRAGPPDDRRRAVSWFLAFTVAVSFGVGLIQREMWPFSTWPVDTESFPAEYSGMRPVVVDREGAEHPLDLRALYPIDWMDLNTWLTRTQRQDPDAFRRVAPWLVDRIAGARRQLESTGRMPGTRRPWAAPPRVVVPPVWTAGDSLTPLEVVGLRIYVFHTNLDVQPYDHAAERRELLLEYLRDE